LKKVAVLQSNYIPWKGYFDIIHDVDLFVFYDDVQYTKNDWRNRNKVKTPAGSQWITIPVGNHNDLLISEVILESADWAEKHWKTIYQFYSKAPYFKIYEPLLKRVYLDSKWKSLSDLNQSLVILICREMLGIKTDFARSQDYHLKGHKTERLIQLLKKCGTNYYLSGPAARDYLDETIFKAEGIQLDYKDYTGYPEYPQFYPPFSHYVTILDLLFHAGPQAPDYIWGWRNSGSTIPKS
jgi:hypothetical protein